MCDFNTCRPGVDGDCTTGECASGLRCEEGRCRVPAGGECFLGRCSGGLVCNDGRCRALARGPCADTGGCFPGLVCEAGACRSPIGYACALHGDCASGLLCEGAVCRPGAGGSCAAVACAAGLVCQSEVCRVPLGGDCAGDVCSAGLSCDAGRCRPALLSGCTALACATGLRCDGGVCKVPPGGACLEGQCASFAVCTGGFCAPVVGGDCSTGVACVATASGTSLSATVPVCDAGTCRVPALGECRPGECADGLACDAGICRPWAGAACGELSCASGLVCEAGVCRVPVGGACRAGACVAAAYCHETECRPLPAMGGDCGVSNACAEGLFCVASRCASNQRHLFSAAFGGDDVDVARGLAVDAGGNVYFGGAFAGTASFGGAPLTAMGAFDLFLARYSPSHGHLWSKAFGGDSYETLNGLAADSSGNVWLTGHTWSASMSFGGQPLSNPAPGRFDAFVAVLDPNGDHVLSTGANTGEDDIGFAVAAGPGFSTAVAGLVCCDAIRVSKYVAGVVLWQRTISDGATSFGRGVALDAQGNVVATGLLGGPADFAPPALTPHGSRDVFVAKFAAANGATLWAKALGAPATVGAYYNDESGIAVAVDAAGDVFVTGQSLDGADFGGVVLESKGDRDIFVAKLSGADGATLWAKSYGSAALDYGAAIAVDLSGNPVVAGVFQGDVDFGAGPAAASGYDGFILKLSSQDGTTLWALDSGGPGTDAIYAVAVGPDGHLFVAGQVTDEVSWGGAPLRSRNGSVDAFLARFLP
jgi:hypothetical protein